MGLKTVQLIDEAMNKLTDLWFSYWPYLVAALVIYWIVGWLFAGAPYVPGDGAGGRFIDSSY